MASFKHVEQFEDSPQLYLIDRRIRDMDLCTVIGPCDLLYFTWQQGSLMKFGATKTKNTFFYAYGLDTSSPASIGCYINSLLSQVEKKSWGTSEWKVKKVLFCIFDSFSRNDIHLEFNIPGQMMVTVYGLDGKKKNFNEIEWEPVYISSVLRSLTVQNVKVGKFYNLLDTKEKFFEFLRVIENYMGLSLLSKKNNEVQRIQTSNTANNMSTTIVLSQNMSSTLFKDIPLDAGDLIRNKGNALINFLCEYIIDRRLYSIGLEFFSGLVAHDKRYMIFLIDVLYKTPHHEETLKAMATILESTPHIILFLFKEAKILTEKGKLKEAVPILKAILQLNPNSPEPWLALSEVYALQRNYVDCLFTLNAMPFYTTKEQKYVDDNFCKKIPKNTPVYMATQNSISNCPSYFVEPTSSDFTFDTIAREMCYLQSGNVEKNQKLMDLYSNLKGRNLNRQMKVMYKILMLISREIGWDDLLTIRSSIFAIDRDYKKKTKKEEKPETKKKEEYDGEKTDREAESLSYFNQASLVQLDGMVDRKIDKAILKVQQERLNRRKSSGNYNQLKLSTKSNQESFFDNEEDNAMEIMTESLGGEKKRVERKNDKLEFLETTWKQLDQDEWSKETMRRRRRKAERFFEKNDLEKVGKRICMRDFDDLFNHIYKDINAYYDFLEEERDFQEERMNPKNNQIPPSKIMYAGEVWIERGMLCDRLLRFRAAEKCYSEALSIGYSQLAVKRLMEIYASTNNPKAAVITLLHMIEFYCAEGFKDITFIPVWAEKVILGVIESLGELEYLRVLKETRGDRHQVLVELANHSRYWDKKSFSVNQVLTSALLESKTKCKNCFLVIEEEDEKE